jgi:hypothetical protein
VGPLAREFPNQTCRIELQLQADRNRATSRARLIRERQTLGPVLRVQLQLFLPAECGDPATIGLEMLLRGVEGFLGFVQALADIFKLILEIIERLWALANSNRLFSNRLATSYHL